MIFESVNEPNGMGWDNATTIAAMAGMAGPHFAAAGLQFIGPATADIDFLYLYSAFEAGFLKHVSGVSVYVRGEGGG